MGQGGGLASKANPFAGPCIELWDPGQCLASENARQVGSRETQLPAGEQEWMQEQRRARRVSKLQIHKQGTCTYWTVPTAALTPLYTSWAVLLACLLTRPCARQILPNLSCFASLFSPLLALGSSPAMCTYLTEP